jgi:transcriptional regulator with XRE-family HTH domain
MRDEAGLTQEQLAMRARVAVATVRKIETGAVVEPGYFTILALLEVLGAARENPAVLGRYPVTMSQGMAGLPREH